MESITLTIDDISKQKKFDDILSKGYGVIDIHELGGKELRFDAVDEFQIPYRCLVPKKVNGLLVAGRCISCDHESLGTLRTIPACMYTAKQPELQRYSQPNKRLLRGDSTYNSFRRLWQSKRL